MGFNTNSWDLVYTSYFESVNSALKEDTLFKDIFIIAETFNMRIKKSKVEIQNENDISTNGFKIIVTCDGEYVTKTLPTDQDDPNNISAPTKKTFKDTKIQYVLKLDELNKKNALLSDIIGGTTITSNTTTITNFESEFTTFLNTQTNLLYTYFAKLTFFDEHKWMDTRVLRIGIGTNPFIERNPDASKPSEKRYYISFNYMISRKDNNGVEKVINNYNKADVDFNVIPEGATSALLIERSLFGEHMVVPQIAENVIVDYENRDKPFEKKRREAQDKYNKALEKETIATGDERANAEIEREFAFNELLNVMEVRTAGFTKESAYSFVNEKECYLQYADFQRSWTHVGLAPSPIEWVPRLFELIPGVEGRGFIRFISAKDNGTLSENMGTITINEDNVGVKLKDVKYWYSWENHPRITQEYIIKFSLAADKNSLLAKVDLSDKSIDYFHTDFTMEIWRLIYNLSKKPEMEFSKRLEDYRLLPQAQYEANITLMENAGQELINALNAAIAELRNDRAWYDFLNDCFLPICRLFCVCFRNGNQQVAPEPDVQRRQLEEGLRNAGQQLNINEQRIVREINAIGRQRQRFGVVLYRRLVNPLRRRLINMRQEVPVPVAELNRRVNNMIELGVQQRNNGQNLNDDINEVNQPLNVPRIYNINPASALFNFGPIAHIKNLAKVKGKTIDINQVLPFAVDIRFLVKSISIDRVIYENGITIKATLKYEYKSQNSSTNREEELLFRNDVARPRNVTIIRPEGDINIIPNQEEESKQLEKMLIQAMDTTFRFIISIMEEKNGLGYKLIQHFREGDIPLTLINQMHERFVNLSYIEKSVLKDIEEMRGDSGKAKAITIDGLQMALSITLPKLKNSTIYDAELNDSFRISFKSNP